MGKVISAALQIIRSFLTTMTGSSERRRKPSVGEILLERFCYHPSGTLGVINIDNHKFYSIERPWLENATNVSCIPEGEYEMGWRTSPRFGETWHIKDVPDRTHILIHVANFSKDVQGCIGLGMDLMGDTIAVSSSKAAIGKFEQMTKGEEWTIKIVNAPFAGL